MDPLIQALRLAAQGFHVFPCQENGKTPVIKDFPNRATRDPEQIHRWFSGTQRNIGVSTSHFGDNQALIVVDVDNKNGKNGDAQILALELAGFELPPSFEQSTPSGGRHLIYVADTACKQGVNVLGDGLDIRSRGGYVVGPGSTIDGKSYGQINGHTPVAPAPQWLLDRLGSASRAPSGDNAPLGGVDTPRAIARALAYLETATEAVEGDGGDQTTYKVAAQLKDLGVSHSDAIILMLAHWNDRCSPPWSEEELAQKISNAYQYGREPPGISAPEAVFTQSADAACSIPKGHPYEELNKQYAFVLNGAFILHETTNEKGHFVAQHVTVRDFHHWLANVPIQIGKTLRPVSKMWLEWEERRQYDGVVFSPGREVGPRWYNLWRGFSVQPAASGSHPAVDQFLDHALNNVCGGDAELYQWLIGYFAHMIQRPWEKPLVALVFKGAKGTGKNALVERVGALLGSHFLVADDRRYLLSNFNSHLESNLFFALDEASWAGDKSAEGKLKGLITGSQHLIERKGCEPYPVDNLTRIAILGNDNWLVPATQDERRFAVFNVGNGRRQDREFFAGMRRGMEQGGYAYLLRFLLDFDISAVDVNAAPATQGLTDQKHESLPPVQAWWRDCISEDALVGSDWEGPLPDSIPVNRLCNAFQRWARESNIRSYLPGRNTFYKTLRELAPSLRRVKVYPEDSSDATYAYKHEGIEQLRADWERYLGD